MAKTCSQKKGVGQVWPGKLGRLLRSVGKLHEQYGRQSAGGERTIGFSTTAQRYAEMKSICVTLHALGYKILDIKNLRQKHIAALLKHWEEKPLKAATLQKYASHLAVLERWIEKPGMMGDPRQYLKDPARFERTYVCNEDKSVEGKGHELPALFKSADAVCPWVGMQLRLQAGFGLRVKESALFRPHIQDLGSCIEVSVGAKNGRYRTVPVETVAQRKLLDDAKGMVKYKSSSLVQATYTYKQWKHHYGKVMRKIGLTKRQLGVTSHGLRHGYLQGKYRDLTGDLCPVKGGEGEVSVEEDRAARKIVAEFAGHSRTQISSVYLGSAKRKRNRGK